MEGTWPDLIQMLIDGEIDLMSDVSYTEERAKTMLYPDLPMGAEQYYLFIDKDNKEISPDDFSTLNGKRVGANKGSVQIDYFKDWEKVRGVQAEIVELTNTVEDALNMLQNGEIDVYLALDSYGDPEKAIPISYVGSSEFYFAVSKSRPDLLDELNFAMTKIHDEDSFYNEEMYEKYNRTSNANLSLTTREANWLKEHGTIRVGYQDNYLAFCAADESGTLTGALKDYLELAQKNLENENLSFEAAAYPTAAEAIEALKKGEVDCVFPANLTAFEGESLDVIPSPSIISSEIYAVVRMTDQKSFVKKESVTCAVNEGNPNYDLFLEDHFPGWQTVTYPNTSACLDAVANNQADCVLLSNYRFNNISQQCRKLNLTTVPTGVYMDYSFAVREGDTDLYSLLARIIRLVPTASVNASLNYYSTEDAKISFSDYLKEHLAGVIAVISTVLLVIVLLILRNVRSEQRADAGEKLISAVERDELTGLYSQNFFYEFANRFYREHPDEPADAIVINIDQFHSVNELNGREFGDEVLRTMGAEILAFLKTTEGIASRFNVDDFYIFCTPQKDYQALFDRFQTRVNQISDHASIRLRMGVMPWKKGMEPIHLLDHAHTASGRVRGTEKHFLIYDEEMLEREHLNERLLNDLDRAIRDHEFQVYYQPKYNITVEPPCLSSAEALVRWKHPELGMISPAKFIPLFEENGLIQKVDRYVWREVATQMAAWREKYGRVLPVSVNVSRIDLYDPEFSSRIAELLKEFRIRREDFMLEITESAYTENSDQIVENVKNLREAGFLIEMDDFGSGYSSLNMISTLPIDVIKLDMQFIRNAFKGHSDTRMLEAVLGIADMLYLPTIAEGVETAEQMQALRGMGCHMVQGYYFSKPVPVEEYEQFLEQRMRMEEDVESVEHSRHKPRLSYEDYSYDELHDPLTGLYNVTAFRMLVKDADQYHTALLLAEIVEAKQILSEQGQDTAEQVLRQVAGTIRSSFRPVDHICRISSSTFAIIMSRVDRSIEEQVRQKVERMNELLSAPDQDLPAVSLAVGVAFADRLNPGESILNDAESALLSLNGKCGCSFH